MNDELMIWVQDPKKNEPDFLIGDFAIALIILKSLVTVDESSSLAVCCLVGCQIHSDNYPIDNEFTLEKVCNEFKLGRTKDHPLFPIAKSRPKFEIDAVMYRCMTSDFVNNGNILGNFVEIIQNMSRQTAYFNTYSQNTYSRWPDGSLKVPTYYSPYIVMAQRSGTGKTRLLFELGRKALPVFYVCLSGPFKSSANICTFLDGLRYKDSFINVLALFASVGDFFLDKLRLEAADLQISCDLSTKSLTANERERIVWALSKYFIPTSEDDPEGFISQSFKDILGRVELWKHKPSLLDYVMERKGALEIRKDNVTKSATIPIFKVESLEILKSLGFGPVVFAIDEARGLLNMVKQANDSSFHQIRRGAMDLFGFISIVLADTSLKLSDFAPQHRHNTMSFRGADALLFPVFHTLCTNDVLAAEYLNKVYELNQQAIKMDHSSSCKHGSELVLWAWLLNQVETRPFEIGFHNLGLPLWSFVEKNFRQHNLSDGNDVVMDNIVNFASEKLVGGHIKMQESTVDKDKADVIAALSSKVFFLIRPQSSLPETLVANRMAHLDFVELDRSKVFASYPSDPILSAGATKLLMSEHMKTFKTLKSISFETAICIGDQGEFLAQLLFCSAIDFINGSMFKSVSLRSFLTSLFGTNAQKIFEDSFRTPDFWSTTKVFFNHFTRINCDLTLNILSFMFSRCAAILSKKGQSGFDLVIPVVLACGHLSALVIQVKNKVKLLKVEELDEIYTKLLKNIPSFLIKNSPVLITLNFQAGRSTSPNPVSIYKLKESAPMYFIEGFSENLYPNIWGNSKSNDIYKDIRIIISHSSFDVDDRIDEEVINEKYKSMHRYERKLVNGEILESPDGLLVKSQSPANVIRYTSIAKSK